MGRWETTPAHRGGSGEPLVLLHGGGGTWRLWKPAIPLLEPSFDVLAPTLAGHWGGPPVPQGEEGRIDAIVDGVESAMDDAGFDTAHVAGGSLGGWVALELARRGRARTVVAVAPAGGWRTGGLAFRMLGWQYLAFERMAPLLARRPERWTRSPLMRKALMWHHFAHPERMDPDDAAHLLVGLAHCAPFSDFLDWARGYDAIARMSEIRCPVLLAFPESDWVLPRRFHGRRLIEALPDATVVDLPGAGHCAMVDEPQLVARTIADFAQRRARDPVAA